MSRTTPASSQRPVLGLVLGALFATGSLSVFAPTATAQVDEQPAVQGPALPGTIDPVEDLKMRLGKLANELRFLRKVRDDGGLVARLKQRLGERVPTPRSVRATTGPAAATPIAKQTGARLMNEEERAEFNPQVIFAVNGIEARQDEYTALATYLRKVRPEGTPEEAIGREAVKELITRKLSKARAGKRASNAFSEITKIRQKLAEGADFAEVAKADSECPSAPQGGDLGMFGRGAMDTTFESVAFSTEKGQRSEIVETPFGYHLIYVEKKSDDGKQVQARHILRVFHDDPGVTSAIINDVTRGNCLVVYRDQKFLSLSPF